MSLGVALSRLSFALFCPSILPKDKIKQQKF
jgi:hypothetical protein